MLRRFVWNFILGTPHIHREKNRVLIPRNRIDSKILIVTKIIFRVTFYILFFSCGVLYKPNVFRVLWWCYNYIIVFSSFVKLLHVRMYKYFKSFFILLTVDIYDPYVLHIYISDLNNWGLLFETSFLNIGWFTSSVDISIKQYKNHQLNTNKTKKTARDWTDTLYDRLKQTPIFLSIIFWCYFICNSMSRIKLILLLRHFRV